ncbi:tubulin-specific chaperone C [Cylas formicarius]|uniref:tubulin-specific chaperone C n=1 Tax=Cylas formicarius TaxID=197179 RepID=UPI002958A3EB|nr:tubulin-specific chaperone C [Cylas formicarius]
MDIFDAGVGKIKTMKERESERQSNLLKRQETKARAASEVEQLSYFEKSFAERQCAVEELLAKTRAIPTQDLPGHFDTIFKEIALLQKYVAASSLFLKSYFVTRCQNIVRDLNDHAHRLETVLLPKKKFGFKTKPTQDQKHSEIEDQVDSDARQDVGLQFLPSCGFSDRRDEVLVLNADEVRKKDVVLERMRDCDVIIRGVPSTLFLNGLSNCRVLSGPVSTSVFAERCNDCTFVIACQQLRLHGSARVDIYLHVTSRAIMEDCDAIRVAPYNWNYEGLDGHFEEASLDSSLNNWRGIDDFNWLNAEKRSPHWCEIEEGERVTQWA